MNIFNMKINKKVAICIASIFLTPYTGLLTANTDIPGQEVTDRKEINPYHWERIKVNSTTSFTGMFGEAHNKVNGRVEFSNTDISIPGNFNIPVEFRRTLTYGQTEGKATNELGRWSIDVPYVKAYFLTNSLGSLRSPGWGQGKECTQGASNFLLNSVQNIIETESFYNGKSLYIPGKVSTILLENDLNRTQDNYRVSRCFNRADGEGEGIEVMSPDGLTYTFDKPVDIAVTVGVSRTIKYRRFLRASKIEDKFGNYVNYNYTDGYLTSITSSDKREISITYKRVNNPDKFWHSHINKVIDTVTAHGRTWKYHYDDVINLAKVERPNGSTWLYEKAFYDANKPIAFILKGEDYKTQCELIGNLSTRNFSIINPQGAKATYSIKPTYFGRSNADSLTRRRIALKSPLGATWEDYFVHSSCQGSYALTKRVINSNNSSNTWQYSYSEKFGGYEPNVGNPPVANDDVANINLYNVTYETLPDKTKKHYFVNRDASSALEGKIEYEFLYDEFDNKISSKQSIYTVSEKLGSSGITGGNLPAEMVVLLSKQVIANYVDTVAIPYTTEYLSHNKYFAAEKVIQYNATDVTVADNKRYIINAFEHDDINNWVLNLPKTISLSSEGANYTIVSKTDYARFKDTSAASTYSNQLLPIRKYNFSQLVKTYKSYLANGHVKKVELNALLTAGEGNRTIEYSDYYRGVPRKIEVQSRNSANKLPIVTVVNDHGWVTSATDFNGTTTHYGYDLLGRIIAVDLTNDISFGNNYGKWLDTFFSWSGNTRTIKRCTLNNTRDACLSTTQFTTTETYDALLRLKERKTEDAQVGTNSIRYQNFKYDHNNQNTFTSFVSHIVDETKGTDTTYDALQRIDTITTSGQGVIQYKYLADNKIQVTDAEDNITTTSYLAYGAPSNQQVIKIESPESIITTIDVNSFGLPKAITQSGLNGHNRISQTEINIYNTDQKLCLKIRNDVGATAYGYNELGEMTWSAQGVTYNNITPACIAKPTANVINYIADNFGDIKKIDYVDALTPDVTYVRDANGNIKSITAGSVKQTYRYNNQNLLESETLAISSEKSYSLDYGYNSLLQLIFTTYPDNSQVYYQPNGYGEATQVASYSDFTNSTLDYAYVKDAKYYTNGMLNSFTYGNEIKHVTERNADSWLPKQLLDTTNASKKVIDLNYTYDNNLNITSLLNKVDSLYSIKRLSYDKLDRLTSTEGEASSGNSTISYDGLGNIRTYSNDSLNNPHSFAYKYDENNYRLTKVIADNNTTVVRDFSSETSYDKRGNVLKNGNTKELNSFSYNLANQMIKAGISNTYVYDGFNRRVKTSKADNKVNYSMYSQSGKLMYRETDKGGINYYFLGRKLVAKEGTGVILAKDKKPEDHSRSLMNYKPFGESIDEASDAVGYTGHKFDKDLGLSYMQARYYDPVIGRFYSNDPVGYVSTNVHSFGRYTYANNNPYKYTDPDGKWGIQIGAGIIGFAIGAVSEMVTNENATFGSTMQAGGVGAVVGVATTFGGGLLGTMAVGGGANGAGELATQVMNGESIDSAAIGVAMAVGTVGGGVAKGLAAKAVPKRGIGNVSKTSANHNSAPGRTPRTMEGGASEIVDAPKRAISEVKQGAGYSTGAVGGGQAANAINDDKI